MALVNVRLDAEDARRVAELRRAGVRISTIVRRRSAPSTSSGWGSGPGDVPRPAVLARIYADLPDTPTSSARVRSQGQAGLSGGRREARAKETRVICSTRAARRAVRSGDALNATAARQLQRLARTTLVASLPVLAEAVRAAPVPVQRRRLRRFLADFAVASYRVEDDLTLWLESSMAGALPRPRPGLDRRLPRRGLRRETRRESGLRPRVPDHLASAGREAHPARGRLNGPGVSQGDTAGSR